jgi:ribosomal protein L4
MILRAVKNLPRISTISVNSLNVIDLLAVKFLIVPEAAIGKMAVLYSKQDKSSQ